MLEVTLRTPNALQVIEEMAKVAGRHRRRGRAHAAADGAGGGRWRRFMVSPGASPRLLDAADEIAIPLLPGIGTPTEAMTASEHGYRFLKFFPAEALGGAPVLKAYASPLPDIMFCPTGGIDLDKARELPGAAQRHLRRRLVGDAGRTPSPPATARASRVWRAKRRR